MTYLLVPIWIWLYSLSFMFLLDNLLYWKIQSNCLLMHANKRILTNGSFKDGIEIETNGSLHSQASIFPYFRLPLVTMKCWNSQLEITKPISIMVTMSYSLFSFILFLSNNTLDITRIVSCSILCLDKALIYIHTLTRGTC